MNTEKYIPQWFASPISLPERQSGGMKVKHQCVKAGTELPIIGWRQAITRGYRPLTAVIQEPTIIHALVHDDDGVWMTDMPEELNQIGELMHRVMPNGNVLIGGLGLGILAKVCSKDTLVNRVVVVERDPDVIKLCKSDGYEVVQADIAEYLRTTNERFDYYLLDTWQTTSEATWWREVVPLRRIIRQKFGQRPVIHGWAEDIMQGQMLRTLTHNPPHWMTEGLPTPMSVRDAKRFLRDVGLPTWEKRYGKIVDGNLVRENP